MSLLAKAVRRVDFGDGEWVEFRDGFPVRQMREIGKIQKKLKELQGQEDREDELFEATLDMLDKCIVGWNVTDAEGNLVPYTREGLYDIRTDNLQKLTEAALNIKDVNETEEETKKELPVSPLQSKESEEISGI